jgi:enediyne biosynthesis protein E4
MDANQSRRLMVLCPVFLGVSLLLAGAGETQTFFTDATEKIGVLVRFPSQSTVFGDYNNDGRPDLFLAQASGLDPKNQHFALLYNEGDGRFTDRTQILHTVNTHRKGGGSLFGDYDNDGDLDLFVSVGGPIGLQNAPNILLRNDRGVFADVTLDAGLTDSQRTDNAIWLDYDQDGYIDLYTGNVISSPVGRNKLHRNNGDGSFTDVTAEVGLEMQMQECCGGSNGGMVAGDFDDDGWPDLYVGAWQDRNRLFMNNGQGGFTDATTAEVGDAGEALGVAVGDIDNDGDLDIFQAAGGGFGSLAGGQYRSLMLLNLGQGQFLDVIEGVGLEGFWGVQTTGPGLVDIDNDGDLDLLTTDPHTLFLNNGDGTFEEQTSRSGIKGVRRTLVVGDYDEDGFQDVIFGYDLSSVPALSSFGGIYRNNGNGNHWLKVELVGTASNRNGIGARLVATAGDLRPMREIFGGRGHDLDEMVAHFGLGQHTQVDELEIRWPSGQVDVLYDIPADQKIRVFEGREGYHVVHPTTWESVSDSLVAGETVDLQATVRPALFEPGAETTHVTADLSTLGGGAEVPLVDRGDGTYAVTPVSLSIEGINGFRTISVMIDQHTSLGPYWTKLSRRLAVLPAEDQVILDEGISGDWLVDTTNVEHLALSQSEVVYAGGSACAVQVQKSNASWQVVFQPENQMGALGFTLRFAIRPGDVTLSRSTRFTVNLMPSSFFFTLLEENGVDLEKKEWQNVEIPLSLFGLDEPIASVNFAGNFEGTFYLDDIRLVAAEPSSSVTAITEEHTATLPQSFTLAQNFPNPFNGSTAIRFSLPSATHIELSIFNLAGQQVTTLVSREHQAGAYTIHWDGRDDDGRKLASGVYLYRLKTGDQQQVETRKLLWLR